MRYLVTGASGFLGAWTVRALLGAGQEVIALTRDARPWRLDGIIGHRHRSASPESWPDVVAEEAPDILISLDWAGVAGPERDSDAQSRNIERLDALVGAALDAGVRRIVGSGSQAEYGWSDEPLTEESALRPLSAYGRAKVAAGELLRARCEGRADWVWARIFSVFGPLDNDGGVLGSTAAALRAGRTLPVSRGGQPWSLLYAPDAARALALVAEPGRPAGVVNVAHPEAPPLRSSLRQFAEAVEPAAGSLAFGADDGPGLRADVTRLASMGWRPEVDTRAALHETARWFSGLPVADPLSGADLPTARS